MERWQAKVLAVVITVVLMLVSVFAPFKMVAKFKKLGRLGTRILDTLGCFTGGVFLGTCLLFLVPEVVNLMHRPESSDAFPLAEFVIAVGFVTIMFLERAVHSCRKKKKKESRRRKRSVLGHGSGRPLGKNEATASSLSATAAEREEDEDEDEDDKSPVETSQLHHGNGSVLYTGGGGRVEEQQAVAAAVVTIEELSSSMLSVVDESEEILATEGATKAVILFVALSLDEFLGGVSMGLQRTTTAVWGILVGLLAHECVVGFSFGLQLAGLSESRPGCFSYALGLSYSLVGPLGAVVGTLIGETSSPSDRIDAVNGILQCLATGVFLYVTFFEILGGKIHSRSRYVDLIAVALGIGVMALIAALPKEEPTHFDGNTTTTTMATLHSVLSAYDSSSSAITTSAAAEVSDRWASIRKL